MKIGNRKPPLLKLLVKWKNSVFELVWFELIIYLAVYVVLSLVYRYALNEGQKDTFERLCLHWKHYADKIPVDFFLGFYVNLVVTRWWNQFQALPWPESALVWLKAAFDENNKQTTKTRQTILRYLKLSTIMTLRCICKPVREIYPTWDDLVQAGVLTDDEKKKIDQLPEGTIPKYWLPLVWATRTVVKARKEGTITDECAFQSLIDKIDKFRASNATLLNYNMVTIPLAYTQVVTLAVYMYLLSTMMTRQFLEPESEPLKDIPGHELDYYVPLFPILQFFFYMGWLKVAESQINPFGEDDYDLDAKWIVDCKQFHSQQSDDHMPERRPSKKLKLFASAIIGFTNRSRETIKEAEKLRYDFQRRGDYHKMTPDDIDALTKEVQEMLKKVQELKDVRHVAPDDVEKLVQEMRKLEELEKKLKEQKLTDAYPGRGSSHYVARDSTCEQMKLIKESQKLKEEFGKLKDVEDKLKDVAERLRDAHQRRMACYYTGKEPAGEHVKHKREFEKLKEEEEKLKEKEEKLKEEVKELGDAHHRHMASFYAGQDSTGGHVKDFEKLKEKEDKLKAEVKELKDAHQRRMTHGHTSQDPPGEHVKQFQNLRKEEEKLKEEERKLKEVSEKLRDAHRRCMSYYYTARDPTGEQVKAFEKMLMEEEEKLKREQEKLKEEEEKLKEEVEKLREAHRKHMAHYYMSQGSTGDHVKHMKEFEKLKEEEEKLKVEKKKLKEKEEKLRDTHHRRIACYYTAQDLTGDHVRDFEKKLREEEEMLKEEVEKLKAEEEKLWDAHQWRMAYYCTGPIRRECLEEFGKKVKEEEDKLKEEVEKLKKKEEELRDAHRRRIAYYCTAQDPTGEHVKEFEEKLQVEEDKLKEKEDQLKEAVKRLRDAHHRHMAYYYTGQDPTGQHVEHVKEFEKLKEEEEKLKEKEKKLKVEVKELRDAHHRRMAFYYKGEVFEKVQEEEEVLKEEEKKLDREYFSIEIGEEEPLDQRPWNARKAPMYSSDCPPSVEADKIISLLRQQVRPSTAKMIQVDFWDDFTSKSLTELTSSKPSGGWKSKASSWSSCQGH